jgi:hypothetical protein
MPDPPIGPNDSIDVGNQVAKNWKLKINNAILDNIAMIHMERRVR